MLKILHNPIILPFAIVGGGIAGGYAWPNLDLLAIHALGGFYQGFFTILFNFLVLVGFCLGATTACAFVFSQGMLRRGGGWSLVVFGIVAICWGAPEAWHFAASDGRRLALAVYGLPILWMSALGVYGFIIQRRVAKTRDL
jgi:hypothetical protein